jgi:hypothetical protein
MGTDIHRGTRGRPSCISRATSSIAGLVTPGFSRDVRSGLLYSNVLLWDCEVENTIRIKSCDDVAVDRFHRLWQWKRAIEGSFTAIKEVLHRFRPQTEWSVLYDMGIVACRWGQLTEMLESIVGPLERTLHSLLQADSPARDVRWSYGG